VTLDGSTGTTRALTGPDYQITENLGQRAGNNLFHSFGRFNLNRSESATFSGSTGIRNVFSRVTGGQTSTIDGLLRSTIPNANLYFINPAGVIFGENARIDVKGSFHTSTADYLGFSDGVRFDSADSTAKPILTTATPEAFGFLGNQPAGKITVSGGVNSILEVRQGETLSLIGGDINLKDSVLYAPGGQINLASVDSAGEVFVSEKAIDTASFTKLGNIHLSRDPEVPRTPLKSSGKNLIAADVDVSADKAGAIFIRSGELMVNNAFIVSDTKISDGGNIDIKLTGDLILNEVPEKPGINSTPVSEIRTRTTGKGDAGHITINANGINLHNAAHIVSSTGKETQGKSGAIKFEAHSVLLDGNELKATPFILTATQGAGDSGAILIDSNQLDVLNGASISTITNGNGDSGTISIPRGKLTIRNGAKIATSVLESANGKAGAINIQSDMVLLSGVSMISKQPSFINSFTAGNGNAGDLSISSDQLDIFDGAQIITSSLESANGKAGSIDIQSDRILLSGIATIESQDTNEKPMRFAAGIYSQALGKGGSGDISVVSNNTLELKDAQISVSTAGSGNTGNLFVKSNHIALNGTSDKILTEISNRVIDVNKNNSATGNSGNLTVMADRLVSKGALITTTNLGQGDSGSLFVDAKSILLTSGTENRLFPGGITSEFHRNSPSASPRVSGGISIKAEDLTMEGETTISAANFGSGKVGLTKITTDRLKIDDRATIDTSTFGPGVGGDLAIKSGSITLSGEKSGLKSISALTSTNKAGNIKILTERLEVSNQASIDASTHGLGLGGNITIHAPIIRLSGKESGIVSGSEPSSFRNAGNITIFSSDLRLDNGAQINASTVSQGLEGFNTRVEEIEQESPNYFKIIEPIIERLPVEKFRTRIGNGGVITLKLGQLEITNKAIIGAITVTSGQAGDVIIDADNIFLNNAFIASLSTKDNFSQVGDEARSGTIDITVNERLHLENNSVITVATQQANAGDININGEGVLILSGKSKIVTSVADGKGKGGDITIESPILALDTSSILANAVEEQGGNITITGLVFESPGSTIDATSQLSMDGLVTLKPDTTISGSISVLPDTVNSVSDQLSERCAARSGYGSSFVTKGRGGIPVKPGELAPSDFLDYTTIDETRSQYPASEEVLSLRLQESGRDDLYPGSDKSTQYSAMKLDCNQ
jgi:filamentous hemagglutinin family protein